MRIFKQTGNYRYHEIPAEENRKRYSLTQRKQIFSEDFYTVERWIAIHEVPADIVPEPDCYVYRFTWMEFNCSRSIVIDEETAENLIAMNLRAFLNGNARKILQEYFKEVKAK